MDPNRRDLLWPALCLVLIAIAGADRFARSATQEAFAQPDPRAEAAAAAAADLVSREGTWVGVEETAPLLEPAPPAVDHLLLTRTYTNILSGASKQVMILHGSGPAKVRRLLPQACFEGDRSAAEPSSVTLQVSGRAVPATQTTLSSITTLQDPIVRVMTLALTAEGWTPPGAAAEHPQGALIIHLLSRETREPAAATATAEALIPLFEPMRERVFGQGDAAPDPR